jgi:hypothetical protein
VIKENGRRKHIVLSGKEDDDDNVLEIRAKCVVDCTSHWYYLYTILEGK